MKLSCLAFACALSLGIAASAAAQEITFPAAVHAYRAGDWSAAYGQFRYLANSGNTEAARIALFMYGHGRLLYGTAWDASDDDVALWSRLAGVRSPLPDQPERVASTAKQQPAVYRGRAQPFMGRLAQR